MGEGRRLAATRAIMALRGVKELIDGLKSIDKHINVMIGLGSSSRHERVAVAADDRMAYKA
jgi:hypothetical protein